MHPMALSVIPPTALLRVFKPLIYALVQEPRKEGSKGTRINELAWFCSLGGSDQEGRYSHGT